MFASRRTGIEMIRITKPGDITPHCKYRQCEPRFFGISRTNEGRQNAGLGPMILMKLL
jgi:hypothetical protein